MPKPKKCKICPNTFQPINSLQKVCSPKCAIDYTREQQKKKDRKELRQRKQALKTKSDLLKEAQYEFNRYTRLRDERLPCISCGRFHEGQYHAGHYRTVGSVPELRFHPWNCHKQCSTCNNYLSGNLVEYRRNLEKRIGKKNLGWLEGPHQPQHWTREDIKEIKQYYREKIKALKDE